MPQLMMDFSTASKINTVRLSSQNKVVYDHLCSGKTINTVQARDQYGIFNLHSRLSDIRNRAGVLIYDRMIRIGKMSVKEYSIRPFNPV